METKKKYMPDPNLKLIEQVRQVLRHYRYAIRTEESYTRWIARYIRFIDPKRHPKDMGKKEIKAFLDHLEINEQVSASTRSQALNAIGFLYRQVLNMPVDEKIDQARLKKENVLPVVLSKDEMFNLLLYLKGDHMLMAGLMYGCGLRLMECIRLRVHNLDFQRDKVYIYPLKGGKKRTLMLPETIKLDLMKQVENVRTIHQKDIEIGLGYAQLPEILAEKYKASARELVLQFLFPSKNLSRDLETGLKFRPHVLESGMQKAIKTAARKAKTTKNVTSNTFRHSFATHLLEQGVDIWEVSKLMGHASIAQTQIYRQVMENKINKIISPLDML
ncbi:MAG: integron integrase [Desulfobacteraceae bacterium]|nr:integron integrase [Desulfobacteraceae bacterium]